MDDEKQEEQDRQRAEVFDALGHPTRIVILKALSEGALGFADLKKKTGMDSSGHLQHHLTKLNGLIKTDEYGKYCLSDQGKDALLTVQTVENSSSEKQVKVKGHRYFKVGLKPVAFLLVALLIASSAVAVYEYSQIVGLHNENTFFKGANPEATAYYNEFGTVVPNTETNSSFAPPISMYQALIIGLQADSWNKTSLHGFTVYINLMPWAIYANSTNGVEPTNVNEYGVPLNPPANYSDFNENGTIFRYVWQIDIQKTGRISIPPYDLILIGASTGQILPNPPLY
jgi:DNA-binding HxlR family transcriptional regulator